MPHRMTHQVDLRSKLPRSHAMNSMLSAPQSPRGARVLDSLVDALMKLFSELLTSSGRVDTDVILTTVTSTIAEHIPATCIAILMKSGPATVGTLGLFDWYAGGVLNEADIDWMQRAADRVGLAIDNAQVRNQAIERLARLTSLSEIALAVASAQDVRQTLKLIVDRVIA